MSDSTLPIFKDIQVLSREQQLPIIIPGVIQNVQTNLFLNLRNDPPVQVGEVVRADLGVIAPWCNPDHNSGVSGLVTKSEHWYIIIQDHTRGLITAILRNTSSKFYINAVKNEAGVIQLIASDTPQVFELVRVGDKFNTFKIKAVVSYRTYYLSRHVPAETFVPQERYFNVPKDSRDGTPVVLEPLSDSETEEWRLYRL